MVDAGPGRGSAVEEPFPLEPPSAARRRGRRPVLGLTSLVVVSLLGYLLVRPDDRDAAQVLSSDPVGEVGLLGITTTGEVVAIDTASAEHRVLLSASETGVEPWPADLPVFDASEDGTMIIGRRDPASGDWDVRRFAPDGEDSVVPAARWPAAEPGGDRMAWLPDTERPRQVLTGTGADDARAVDLSGALSTPTFDAELRGPLVWVSEEEVYVQWTGADSAGGALVDLASSSFTAVWTGELRPDGPAAARLGPDQLVTAGPDDDRQVSRLPLGGPDCCGSISDPGTTGRQDEVVADGESAVEVPGPDGRPIGTTLSTLGPATSAVTPPPVTASVTTVPDAAGPSLLFETGAPVLDVAAVGEAVFATVGGEEPELLRWTEAGGVVSIGSGVTALATGRASPAPDPMSSSTTATTTPPGPVLVWEVVSDGLPALEVGEGVLIAAGSGLWVLDQETGEQLWVVPWDDGVNDDARPVVSGPVVVVSHRRRLPGAFDSIEGVVAYELRTGEPLWVVEFAGDSLPTPLRSDGERVFAAAIQYEVELPPAVYGTPSAVALDLRTGELVWDRTRFRAEVDERLRRMALGEGVVILQMTASLVGVTAADGQELWRYELPVDVGPVDPVVDGGLLVSVYKHPVERGRATGAVVLRTETGDEVTRVDWATQRQLATMVDGTIYLYEGGAAPDRTVLVAVDATTGADLWSFDSAVRIPDVAVGGGLAVVSTDAALYFLDATTGELLHSQPVPDIPTASFNEVEIDGDLVFAHVRVNPPDSDRLVAYDVSGL